MERRTFLQQSTLAGISALAFGGAAAANAAETQHGTAQKTFNLDYAPHAGMFKNSAGDDFLDQIRFMHDQGFRSIEDNGMLGRDTAQQNKIGELLAKLGMRMGVFVIDGARTGKYRSPPVKKNTWTYSSKPANAPWSWPSA